MEKVELRTADIAAENAAKLAELFPDIVTEVLDEDGSVRHSIDVEALKAHVGDIAEDKRERYQFTWPGKQKARAAAIRTIDKTMRPCPEESVNWDTTENLYIEGDNLDALKILRKTYAGKIKMIYIDPPYNTGHDFVYNDDFARSAEEERAESGAFDEEGNVLDAAYKVNNESNGKFHSDWCSMMYPRLVLARDLLSEDGVIFISIDDSEQGTLLKLVSEVFGELNFIGTLIHQRAKGGGQAKYIVKGHDYVHVFAKSLSSDVVLGRKKVVQGKTYLVGGRECLKDDDVYRKVFGKYEKGIERRCMYEELLQYKGDRVKAQVDERLKSGDLFLEEHPSGMHVICRWIPIDSAISKPYSIIKVLSELGKNDLDELNVEGFSYPKPAEFVRQVVELATIKSKNAAVLDFFSGSATTAHAVMQLNAEDGGNRKFIMVQLPEVCDEKSEAAKAGYKNICEIGKERIRRAGAKIAAEVEESNAQLKLGEEPKRVPDIGFRVLKIDSSNFEDVQRTPDAIQQDQLFGLADNVKSGRTPEDILFQLFPKLEIPYTARIDKLDICGKTVYSVDDDMLVACFDREVPEDVVRAMAQREPAWAVLRDASFTGDDALANFEEIFKIVSPETKTRVV